MKPVFQEGNRWAAMPTTWGQSDCMLVLADWVARATGVDVAAEIRGKYFDAPSAEVVTGWLSDPVGCAARFFDPVLERIEAADRAPGDIAVLMTMGQPHGGLWNGRSWFSKGTPDGGRRIWEIKRTGVLAAWRVPDVA